MFVPVFLLLSFPNDITVPIKYAFSVSLLSPLYSWTGGDLFISRRADMPQKVKGRALMPTT